MGSFMLMDSAGNAIEWYRSYEDGEQALREIVDREPEAREHMALAEFDEDGLCIGASVLSKDNQLEPAA